MEYQQDVSLYSFNMLPLFLKFNVRM